MTNHNLSDYLKLKYSHTQKTITEISKSDNGKGSLVVCDKMMYCFDDISSDIYSNDKPASMDGVKVIGKEIFLVEFKSGFRQLISKKNYDPTIMTCPRYELKCSKINNKECADFKVLEVKKTICSKTGSECIKALDYCFDYGDLFLKKQISNKEELKQNIRMKVIESFITLEKEIFPKCQLLPHKCKLNLIVVIDGNGDDTNVAILEDLSCKKVDDKENDFINIKKSLAKYVNKKDCTGNDYYYDTIQVMDPTQFKKFAEEKFTI